MKTTIGLAALLLTALAAIPAAAETYIEFPAPTPYPFQRSYRTGRLYVIPPYRHLFVQRVFTTPPEQPLYNVPPYSVVAPF